jgi:hypothetical protein
MDVVTSFFANLGLGAEIFFPVVVTLIVMMSLFAYDEIGSKRGDALEVDKS